MSGIGGQDVAGKLVTVQAELPEDIDGILDAIRKIVMLGEVQSITIKNDEPIVYRRFVRTGEALLPEEDPQSYAELAAYEIVRNVPMDEWEPKDGASPYATLVQMFMDMAARGWVVTHMMLAENTKFWRWLDAPIPSESNLKQFLGARIEQCKELPSEVFILCGSRTRHATIAEIGLALKGAIHGKRVDTKSD